VVEHLPSKDAKTTQWRKNKLKRKVLEQLEMHEKMKKKEEKKVRWMNGQMIDR
jgi:hypothetical protein